MALFLLSLSIRSAAQESCTCSFTGSHIAASPTGTNISTLSLSNPLVNDPCHRISGQLIIDTNFTFSGGYLILEPGAEIVVNTGVTLTLTDINDFGGIHGNCDTMWRGITLLGSAHLVMDNCHLRDAQYAIQCYGRNRLTLTDNYFDRNYVSIYTPPGLRRLISSIIISGNTFTCDNELLEPFPGQSPVPNTRSFAGIELNNARFILGSNTQYHPNVFRLMQNGIVARRSTLSVYDAEITSLTPQVSSITDEFQISPPAGPDGYGVYAMNQSIVGVYNTRMDEVRRGIHVERSSLFASADTIENSVHGITDLFATGPALISGNIISFQHTGIRVEQVNYCHQVEVTQNNLEGYYDFSAFANNLGVGIRVHGIPGVCLTAPEISDNYISISNKFNGIGFQEVWQNALIDDNTVVYYSDDTPVIFSSVQVPPNGIAIGTSDLLRLRHNSVLVPEEIIYVGEGINVTNSTNATFCDNQVAWMANGISFFLMCDNAIVRLNQMGDHDYGLYYNFATVTGQQDNQGNEWNGDGGARHDLGNNSPLIDFSRYFVEDCPNPPLWPPSITPMQSSCQNQAFEWFHSGEGTIPSNCTDIPTFNELTVVDQHTAEGVLDTITGAEALAWEAKRHLYRKLSEYPGAMEGNQPVLDFYDAYETENLATFYAVDAALRDMFTPAEGYSNYIGERLEQIETAHTEIGQLDEDYATASSEAEFEAIADDREAWMDSLDMAYSALYDTATARETARLALVPDVVDINHGVDPDNDLEENVQLVNEVYLETVAAGIFSLDAAQIAQLNHVAEQCPHVGGDAVFRARRLLLLALQNEYDDDDLCSESRPPQTSSTNWLNNNAFQLFPNPTTGLIQIWLEENLNKVALEFLITDPTGRVIQSARLDAGTKVFTSDLSSLAPGLYFCFLNSASKNFYQGKIVVIH